jgi:lysophospholipase L1-like esterase
MNLGNNLKMTGARGGPFSPASLSGLAAWWDPSDTETLFQDAAGSIPVTASGDPVGLMYDKSGRGHHLTASGAQRPTYTVAGGVAYLAFNGTSNVMLAPDSALLRQATMSFCIGAQLASASNFPLLMAVADGASTASTRWQIYHNGGSLKFSSNVTTIHQAVGTATDYVANIASDGANINASIDNSGDVTKAGVCLTTPFALGFTFGGGYLSGALNSLLYYNGRIYGAAIYGGALNADARVNLSNWMGAKQGRNLVLLLDHGAALGDSTVAAYNGSNAITDYFTTPQTLAMLAVPAHTIVQQKTQWTGFANKARTKWAVVQVGLNDLVPAEAASVAIARLQDLVTTIKQQSSLKTKVLIAKMTPARQRMIDLYGATDGLVAYQKWLDMNAAIAGTGPTPIAGVAGRITTHTDDMNDGAGNLAAAYDTGDHVHPNNAGRQIDGLAWNAGLIAANAV